MTLYIVRDDKTDSLHNSFNCYKIDKSPTVSSPQE